LDAGLFYWLSAEGVIEEGVAYKKPVLASLGL
jgi:hypothetical protein